MKLNDLLASELALPSIPKVIALLLNELDQDEPDLRKVSQLINTDPVLTARLLQLANSAQFQLSNKIGGVSEALALMGLMQVRGLATAAAVAGAFRSIPGIDLPVFWQYSLDVAKLSRALAGMLRQNQQMAFTAGLVHAVGELVMHVGLQAPMAELNAHVAQLSLKRAKAETDLLGYCYAEVGAGFARRWQFPPRIIEALEHQCVPFEKDAYEPLAGVLHLASWRVRARAADYDQGELADRFPDVVALALGLDIDMVLQQNPIEWTTRVEAAAFA
jgi:HD-like signal output (HDOD) protein